MEKDKHISSWLADKFKASELFFSQKNIFINSQNNKMRKFKSSKVLVVLSILYASYQGFNYLQDKYIGTKIIEFRPSINSNTQPDKN